MSVSEFTVSDRRMPDAELPVFTALLGQMFEIRFSDTTARLALAEATATGAAVVGVRQSFSLIFHGTDGVMLHGQTYIVCHPVIGELPIFMVPIGWQGEQAVYQAVFS